MKRRRSVVARYAPLACFALLYVFFLSPAIAADTEPTIPAQTESASDSPPTDPQQGTESEPTPIAPEEVDAEPHPAETHYVLGMSRLNSGDLIGAVEELREALRLHPEFVQARMSLGTALYQLGDLDSAIDSYQAALRSQPDLAQAHINLATIYAIKREWTTARNELHIALKLQPDSVQAQYALGVVRYGLGDRRGAIEAYREALRLKPDYADAHYNLGLLLKLANQDSDAAQEFYAAALAGLPKAQYFLGSAHLSGRGVEKNLSVAVQWLFQAAEQKEPQAKEALSQLRQSIFTKGRRSQSERDAIIQAFADFRATLWNEYPQFDKQASDCVGAALLQQDRPREALSVLIQEASALSEPAQTALESLYEHGLEGELAPFNEEIRIFFKTAADEGVPRPRLVMARFYAQGIGMPKDVKKAKALLKGEPSEEAKALLRNLSEPVQAAGQSKAALNPSP